MRSSEATLPWLSYAKKSFDSFADQNLWEQVQTKWAEQGLQAASGAATVAVYYLLKFAIMQKVSKRKQSSNKNLLMEDTKKTYKMLTEAANKDVDALLVIMDWLQTLWNSDTFARKGERLRRSLLVKFANAGMLFTCNDEAVRNNECILNSGPTKYTKSARGFDPSNLHDCRMVAFPTGKDEFRTAVYADRDSLKFPDPDDCSSQSDMNDEKKNQCNKQLLVTV
eukprot:g410.t1